MISIIIPYWNAAKWIGRCADSLTSQKGDFEFIFVDDFSTDNPAFKTDDRCVLVQNRHSKGVSGARNTGLDIAKGEWVSFLDADDELLPDAWLKFNRILKRDADIHQANHLRHYVSTGRLINRWNNHEGMYVPGHLPYVWFGVWNKLIRRSLLDGIRFDEQMQYGEDEMFIIDCLIRSPMIHCSDVVTVKYNIDNKQSLSHVRTQADLKKELEALIRYEGTIKDPFLVSEVVERIRNCEQIMKHEQQSKV